MFISHYVNTRFLLLSIRSICRSPEQKGGPLFSDLSLVEYSPGCSGLIVEFAKLVHVQASAFRPFSNANCEIFVAVVQYSPAAV